MRIIILAIFAFFFATFSANAECLKVQDDEAITLSDSQLETLKGISFERKELFEALYDTSEFETRGCWATPVGNFDAQTLSVGVLQWNYGQNSLQGLMRDYKASFETPDAFATEIAALMPNYGNTAFADECLLAPFTQSCKDKILSAHENGKLNPTIQKEYEALFNSLRMRQVQTNTFVNFLGDLKPKLIVLFGETPSKLQTKWGIDIAIQQGFIKYGDNQTGFLNPADVTSVRTLFASLDEEIKTKRLLSTVRWYSALCGGIYQGVTDEICNINIKSWCAVIVKGISDEQADLMNLTYVRSRIAQGQSGRWQANAFSRRAKIVLNAGRVGAIELPLPRGVRKTRKCNNWLV